MSLGIIPCGTGNDIARALQINTITDGISTLIDGISHAIDVIEVQCRHGTETITRYGLLYAACGFTSAVLEHTTPAVKRWLGARYCYSVGFLRALVRYRSPYMTVETENGQYAGMMFAASVGNAEFVSGGTMRLSPGACIDDGQLNISLIEHLGIIDTLRYFPRLLDGSYISLPMVHYFQTGTISIHANPEVPVAIDGDLCGHTPAVITMKPAALRIMAPARMMIGRAMATDRSQGGQ